MLEPLQHSFNIDGRRQIAPVVGLILSDGDCTEEGAQSIGCNFIVFIFLGYCIEKRRLCVGCT